jgi:tripartite-type tricarboxylate transporter receptor subunit TctC
MRNMLRISRSVVLMMLAVSVAFFYVWKAESSMAGEFPEKNVNLIVPYSPGGGFDIISRITAPFIEKYLPKKTNVVVKNVTGAATRIGTMEILRSEPDGYTIGICEVNNLGFGLMGLAQELKGVKPEDVTWISRLTKLPFVWLSSAASGFKSAADMKDKPVRLGGVDASNNFKSAVTAEALGAKYRIIKFDGASQVNVALMQGDVDAYMSNWGSAKRMVDASEGKIVALFVVAEKRLPEWPEVPTAKECGLLNLKESLIEYNHYFFAPPKMPANVEKIWEDTMNKVLKDPEWIAQMQKAGYPPNGSTGAELKAEVIGIYKETEKYKDLVTRLGIK